VQCEELIPLMLNEMQHQRVALNTLKAQNVAIQTRLNRLEGTKTLVSRYIKAALRAFADGRHEFAGCRTSATLG
jgi:hypothetical protein